MERLTKLIPSAVRTQLTKLKTMQQLVTQSLPTKLGKHIQVTRMADETLTITADNQSWANNLRYYEDQILFSLNTNTGISDWTIRIRAKSTLVNTRTSSPKEIQEADHTTHPNDDQENEDRTRLRKLLKRI